MNFVDKTICLQFLILNEVKKKKTQLTDMFYLQQIMTIQYMKVMSKKQIPALTCDMQHLAVNPSTGFLNTEWSKTLRT